MPRPQSGVDNHMTCLHLILFVSRFLHAQSEVAEQMWTDSSAFQEHVHLTVRCYYLKGIPEANTFGRSEANNCRAEATQAGRRGFSKDRFWLFRLKPSDHVCHAIVHLLWKSAILDPNLLKLTYASDGAAEHHVRAHRVFVSRIHAIG